MQYPTYGPSGSTTAGPDLGYAVDSMGRLNTMTDLGSSSTIISGATYGPSSELLSIGGSYNETRTYNSMLQLLSVAVAPYGSTTVNMSYAYSSTQNNGKITSQTDNISGETVVYTYDSLNRLATAGATSGSWGQSYGYDGFGNLASQTVTAGSAPAYSVAPDPTTNHVGSTDANGNSTDALTGGYPAYDVMNRLVAVGTGYAQYSYAPSNKRVWRGIWTSSTLTTDEVTFWSISGQKLATYSMQLIGGLINSSSATPQLVASQATTNYYFGGKLIKNGNSPVGYVGSDRVGSIGKYYPYGQEKPSATTNGTEKFTGYVRDSETGLDYANARYLNPGTGRFLSADPYTASAGPSSPGSWNRYAYVQGDPINFKDPRGLYQCYVDDDEEDLECEGDGEVCEYFSSYCVGGPDQTGTSSPGGAGAPSPQWIKALAKLSNANNLLQSLIPSPACQGDLDKLAAPPFGITLSDIQTQVNNSQWADGTSASLVYQYQLFTPGTDAYNFWLSKETTIQQFFKTNSGVGAETAFTISDLSGAVYFRPGYVNHKSTADDAGLLFHEALHSLGLDDDQVKSVLGLTAAQCGNGTSCISQLISVDCFGVKK